MRGSVVDRIRAAVDAALPPNDRVLLAVSGGVDSMVLLDAAAAVRAPAGLAVATFDHGTGPHASDAVRVVSAAAGERGITVVAGAAEPGLHTEREWRDARWTFLRATALARNAVAATAHTRDDQVETILLRVLRQSGTRGLAGLYAPSPHLRPMLGTSRAEVERYAAAVRLAWVEDPTNRSSHHARNRLRRDILPALRRARVGFDREVLGIGRAAADWRSDAEHVADRIDAHSLVADGRGLDVDTHRIGDLSAEALGVLWPVMAGRIGLAMDWRGIERVVAFTQRARTGATMPLSGGWSVARTPTCIELRRTPGPVPPGCVVAPGSSVEWDGWFLGPTTSYMEEDLCTAWIPTGSAVVVRSWAPGDVLEVEKSASALSAVTGRKVKRYLTDARVFGHARVRWPVVTCDGMVAWIPGVRRAAMASPRGTSTGMPYRVTRRPG